MSGYKIINFEKKSLSTTKVVIDGIYDAIESSLKAVLCENVVIGETEYKPFFVLPTVSSGDYVFIIDGYTVTITDDDEVTAEAVS